MNNLTTMTIVELKVIAKEAGLVAYSKLNKAHLINLISCYATDVTVEPVVPEVIKEVVAEEEVVVLKEEIKVASPVAVYSVGSYVLNINTGSVSRVGEVFMAGERQLVHTFMFISKKVALKEVDLSVESLNNTKVYSLLTGLEVSALLNKVVVPDKKFTVNVTKSKSGLRDWSVTDNTTAETFKAVEGHSVTNLIRSYQSSFKGHTTNVEVRKIAAKTEDKKVEPTTVKAHVCDCCGKEVTNKQFLFIKNNQKNIIGAELKGKVFCYNCQIKNGVSKMIKDGCKIRRDSKLQK